MTVTDFVASIPQIGTFNHTERIKLFAWYLLRYQNKTVFTADDIKKCFEETTLERPSSIRPFLDSLENRKPKVLIRHGSGFALEHNIITALDKRYRQRPSAVVVKTGLKDHLSKVTDAALKDYLEETIECLEHGCFRASIVMGWCAGYAILTQWLFAKHLAPLNKQISTWKEPKTISRIEDFQEHKEATILDTARKAGLTSKDQDKQLGRLLEDRNSFAHPSGRLASAVTAESYLTQIIDDVIAKFS